MAYVFFEIAGKKSECRPSKQILRDSTDRLGRHYQVPGKLLGHPLGCIQKYSKCPRCVERCLLLVPFADPDEVVGIPEVQFGENMCVM